MGATTTTTPTTTSKSTLTTTTCLKAHYRGQPGELILIQKKHSLTHSLSYLWVLYNVFN